MRAAYGRNGDATDIVGWNVVYSLRRWSDEQWIFAAGISRFGTLEKLGLKFIPRDIGRHLRD